MTFVEPAGYDIVGKLLSQTDGVITDSAGLQEECAVTATPCVVVGPPTARPRVLDMPYIHHAGFDIERCISLATAFVRPEVYPDRPKGWDTSVGRRFSEALAEIVKAERWC